MCISQRDFSTDEEKRRLANELETTPAALATELALGEVNGHAVWPNSPEAQDRLARLVDIINRVEPYVGSDAAAYRWFEGHRLASFGGATPAELVREGRAESVLSHLDRVGMGGYT